jgi:hypothetical protein
MMGIYVGMKGMHVTFLSVPTWSGANFIVDLLEEHLA